MRKYILVLVFILFLCGCDKINSNKVSSYTTQYEYGKTYVQTFYVGSQGLCSTESGGFGVSYFLVSACRRINFHIYEGEENFDTIRPDKDYYNDIVRKNNELKDSDLKYYAIANIRFTYNFTVTNPERLTDWETVIGKMEEYIFDGKIYEHLVIVDK